MQPLLCLRFLQLKIFKMRTSLKVQWLRLCTFTAGSQVQSLVGELRSHRLCGVPLPPPKKSKMLRHHDVGAGRRSTADQSPLPVQGGGLEDLRKPPGSHYEEHCEDSLKKLEIELPHDPAIPLLGIHTEQTRIEKDMYTPMFMQHCLK